MKLSFKQMQALEYCLLQLNVNRHVLFKYQDQLLTGTFLSDNAIKDLNDAVPNNLLINPIPEGNYYANLAWWQFKEQNKTVLTKSNPLTNNGSLRPDLFVKLLDFIDKLDNQNRAYATDLTNVILMEHRISIEFMPISENDEFEPISLLASQQQE